LLGMARHIAQRPSGLNELLVASAIQSMGARVLEMALAQGASTESIALILSRIPQNMLYRALSHGFHADRSYSAFALSAEFGLHPAGKDPFGPDAFPLGIVGRFWYRTFVLPPDLDLLPEILSEADALLDRPYEETRNDWATFKARYEHRSLGFLTWGYANLPRYVEEVVKADARTDLILQRLR